MVYIPRTVGHTIQCSAFVCSGRLSPGRQRHNEENNHSLVGSRPDLINHDTSSLPDAPASCRADDQCARGGTNCAAERQKLDAGFARDRRLNRDESREGLHSIQRHHPIKAAPLAYFGAPRQRRRTPNPTRPARNESRDCSVHFPAWLGCARPLDNWCKSFRRTSTIRL